MSGSSALITSTKPCNIAPLPSNIVTDSRVWDGDIFGDDGVRVIILPIAATFHYDEI